MLFGKTPLHFLAVYYQADDVKLVFLTDDTMNCFNCPTNFSHFSWKSWLLLDRNDRPNNEVSLHYLKETPEIIIKVQVRSRLIKSKTYNCFVEYSPNTTGYGVIRRWCCECANGQRTIGCCTLLQLFFTFQTEDTGQACLRTLDSKMKVMKITSNQF